MFISLAPYGFLCLSLVYTLNQAYFIQAFALTRHFFPGSALCLVPRQCRCA